MVRVSRGGLRRRQVRIALALIVVASLLAPAAAIAARGGNKGGGGGKTSPASMVVTPDPVAAGGATYTVTGSGFTPNSVVHINEARPGCCSAFNVWADAAGRIEFTRSTGFEGTYTVKALQKKKRRTVTLAEVSFEVVGG